MQRKPFRSPLAAATRHVWAVAQLTVGEALRSRFLLGVVLLGVVAMLAAAGGQAVSEADRAMLLRQTLLQLVGTITVVATLFLAAFAIPGDIESRRIFTLVTKPISRGGVVLGRFLGFAVLALMLLGLLGAIAAGVLVTALAGADPAVVAPRPRALPAETAFWGDSESRVTRAAGDGTRELVDPHHAGVLARFRHVDRAMFHSDEGPVLRLRTRLRLRSERQVRPVEVVEVAAAPMGAEGPDVWRTTVPVRTNEPIHVRLPWEALGRESEGLSGWQTEVTVTVTGLPYTMVVAPDSLQLLGAPRGHVEAFLVMLVVEATKVLFVLAAVLALSCVFSPYTAILGGFFTVLAANLVGQVPAMLDVFSAQLQHAHRLKFVDPSLAAVEAIMGDPTAPGFTGWTLVRTFAEVFPSFDRYPLTADYVAGIVPEWTYVIGTTAYLAFGTIVLLIVGATLFTLRDHP